MRDESMQWDNIYLLSFPPNNGLLESYEDIVTITSDAMYIRYSIKPENCYSLNRVTGKQGIDILGKYSDIYKDCMKTEGKLTKLIVVGHYDTFSKFLVPYRFAELITFCGAQSVTYISFKVCNIGKTDYLHNLRDYLPKIQLFSGYKDTIVPNYSNKKEKTKYSIRLGDNVIENFLHKVYGGKLPDFFRRQIVLGRAYNADHFIGTKYHRN